MTSRPSIARALARFSGSLQYDQIPPDVAEKAKVCLLHGLGIGLAGHAEPVSQPALAFVHESERANSGGASVLGTDLRATAAGAAYANSVLLHARLQEDAYRTASHPGSTIIPAALAIAELTSASGRDLLAALVAGYEVMAAVIADATPLTTRRGFRATPLYGGIGAAATAGGLLGLDEDRLTTALAFAATLTGGTTGGMGGGMSALTTHNAWAARNGLLAASLAAAGTRLDEHTFEAPGGFYAAFAGLDQPPPVADHLGKEWRIHEVTLKRYPSAMFNQPVIHLALQIARDHGPRPEEIERIELEMADFEIRYPSNAAKETDERLAAPGLVAAQTLAEGRGPRSPSPLADPPSEAARALQRRLVLRPGRSGLSPRLTVVLRDGSTFSAETENAADFRFGYAEDAAIVRHLVPVMPVEAAAVERLIDDCRHVERLADIRPLLVTPSPPA